MSFYVYLLQCSDQSFYIGHTDNMEARLVQHQRGELKGCYTKSRLPVVLLKAGMFETREEALSAEQQMKGWTRVKKLAWVNDDYEAISRLGKKKFK